MNACVCNCRLPVQQVRVLFLKATECTPLQGVLLHIVNASLDFAFMPGRAWLGRHEYRAVMIAKAAELWVQVRVVPVGFDDGRFEIVGHQCLGNTAEMTEGILQAADQFVGRLAIDDFAVAFARMAEEDSQDMGSSALSVLTNDWSPRAKVDLSFFARSNFDAPKRKWCAALQFRNKATHAVILALKAMFLDEILIDPLSCQALIELVNNDFSEVFTEAS